MMNKACFPKDDDISIMHQLYAYRCGAMRSDKFFNEGNYKWLLSISVCNDIDAITNTICHSQDEKRMLFGIAVEIDYQNPYRMELWKNITNDV